MGLPWTLMLAISKKIDLGTKKLRWVCRETGIVEGSYRELEKKRKGFNRNVIEAR